MTEQPNAEVDGSSMDPKLFQEMLIDIVKNVVDQITLEGNDEFKTIPASTKHTLRKTVIESVRSNLETLMEREAVGEKIIQLRELARESSVQPAWRPKTGEIPIDTLLGHYAEKKKMKLIKKISETSEESLELQKEIIQRRKAIEEQLKRVERTRNAQVNEFQKIISELRKPFN